MQDLSRYIEQTNLSAIIVDEDVALLVNQAKEHRFLGICLPPFWVKKAAREIGNEDIQLITVVGFPLGYSMTQTKIAEIEQALDDGANELDIVMNVSAFKSGMPWVKIELAKCARVIHEQGAIMKVIIETDYLSDEEIIIACKLCQDAGADYVKTSTGFAASGANVDDIKLMRKTLSSSVGVKASGGIKTYAEARALIDAGADRIGTSSGPSIINSADSNKNFQEEP